LPPSRVSGCGLGIVCACIAADDGTCGLEWIGACDVQLRQRGLGGGQRRRSWLGQPPGLRGPVLPSPVLVPRVNARQRRTEY
jgi:hypothetical protein